MNDLTVLVKTILRPEKCRRCLETLREHFDGPVIVCDDSRYPYPEVGAGLDVEWRTYPHDIGIGHCLNDTLSSAVRTPYTALFDDDFLVTEECRMELWMPYLRDDKVDLMGGAVKRTNGGQQGYLGWFKWADDRSWLKIEFVPNVEQWTEPIFDLDIVMNFFAARTLALLAVGWDEQLKVCRHEDFFLRARQEDVRVAYHPGVLVMHDGHGLPHNTPEYAELRSKRMPEYRAKFGEKWGLDPKRGMLW